MISVDALRFGYPSAGPGGGFVLDIPSLSVTAGEKLAVVGPSGTGKTTLLNLLSGIAVADAGKVEVDGVALAGLNDARRRAFRASRIGFVFQNFALLDYLTARENILYPYRIGRGLKLDRAVRDRAQELAEACGIGAKIDRRPAALSQGEQQRVAICRALVTEPALILADEATGNLDPSTKTLILDLLFERAEAAGATLVAVTHDHDLLPRFDRVVDFADYRGAA